MVVFAFYSYRPGQNKCKLKVKIACRTGVIFSCFLGEQSRKQAWSARHTRRGKALSSGMLGCRLLKRTCVLCACVCFGCVNISCAYDCFARVNSKISWAKNKHKQNKTKQGKQINKRTNKTKKKTLCIHTVACVSLQPSSCPISYPDLLSAKFVFKRSGYEITAMPSSMLCLKTGFFSLYFQLRDSTVLRYHLRRKLDVFSQILRIQMLQLVYFSAVAGIQLSKT